MGPYKTIGVIPARGGSKSLPRKNIVDLGGKPLLAYTVEAALDAKCLDTVLLSTDDDEIADVGRRFGVEVPFKRPSELATDTSHSPDVMEHAITFVEERTDIKYDIAVMLQPTSPFRTARHIDEAMDRFLAGTADSLVSVKKQDYPPWWMFKLENERLVPILEYHDPGVNVFNLERQQFSPVYRPNGAIYIIWRRFLTEYHDMVNPHSCCYYTMELEASVDIDNYSDLYGAEKILASKNGK